MGLKDAPRFPISKPIDLDGVILWTTEITYDDPDFYERVIRLPSYEVRWYPSNITGMTWPG